jgi:hypothetical protein
MAGTWQDQSTYDFDASHLARIQLFSQMTTGRGVPLGVHAVIVAALVFAPKPGFAQTDEIQVYDAEIAAVARSQLTIEPRHSFAGTGLTARARNRCGFAFLRVAVGDRSEEGESRANWTSCLAWV